MDRDFDVVVVGAGMAGVACAGELVRLGLRPILVCETAEVASTLRPQPVGSRYGFTQQPCWQVAWGGGWWFPLARALNVPVRLHPSPRIVASIWGSGRFIDIPISTSATALADVMSSISPVPLDSVRGPLERILHLGLGIPYDELLSLHEVPITDWLKEQEADDLVAILIVALIANLEAIPIPDAARYSVLGVWGALRTWLCGEGSLMVVEPNPRDGLCVPICDAVEQRGGVVRRGCRVQRVRTDGGRAGVVELADGTVLEAPAVAIATGNSRIRGLFDELPAEAEAPLRAGEDRAATEDFIVHTVIDRPLVTDERFVMLVNPDGSNLQWSVPIHQYRWTADPDTQFVVSCRTYPVEVAEKLGGRDGIMAEVISVNNELWPGFADAVVDSAVQQHRHGWSTAMLSGPKLPRRVESVDGLWFVGDGSTPVGGLWVEAAASAGVLGARSIAEADGRVERAAGQPG